MKNVEKFNGLVDDLWSNVWIAKAKSSLRSLCRDFQRIHIKQRKETERKKGSARFASKGEREIWIPEIRGVCIACGARDVKLTDGFICTKCEVNYQKCDLDLDII